MSSIAHVLLLFLATSLACSRSARVVQQLDFGWKFQLATNASGLAQDLCPSDSFDSFDGQYCKDWGHQAAYQLTEAECRSYCCGDPSCLGYLYSANWEKGGQSMCVVGNDDGSCIKTDAHGSFTGGIRRGGKAGLPAKVIEPPAKGGPQDPDFDDSAWHAVQVPHDYVIEQVPGAEEEKNHGYRAKPIAWYRLELNDLPSAEVAAASRVWLEFEGVYRASDVWLNGKLLGHHSSGYTEFQYDITEAATAAATKNVLAIRVDPGANEGT